MDSPPPSTPSPPRPSPPRSHLVVYSTLWPPPPPPAPHPPPPLPTRLWAQLRWWGGGGAGEGGSGAWRLRYPVPPRTPLGEARARRRGGSASPPHRRLGKMPHRGPTESPSPIDMGVHISMHCCKRQALGWGCWPPEERSLQVPPKDFARDESMTRVGDPPPRRTRTACLQGDQLVTWPMAAGRWLRGTRPPPCRPTRPPPCRPTRPPPCRPTRPPPSQPF